MRGFVCVFFVILCGLCFADPGLITLEGIFWEPTLDAEFRTDAGGLTGTRLSPTDLNWDPTTETYGAHARFSLVGLGIIRGSYHSLFFEGSVTLTQPIVIGEYAFAPGTTLRTTLLMENYGLGVLVPFLPTPFVRVNVGLYLGATRYILRATGIIVAIPPRRETVTIDTYMPIAAPMAEASVRLPGIRWLYGIGSVAFIAYNEKDQKVGRFIRIKVAVRLAPSPLLAVEAGFLSQSTDYEDKDPNEGFTYHEVTTGFFAGAVVSF